MTNSMTQTLSRPRTLWIGAALSLVPLLCAGRAEASDPVGVYAAIKKVSFEPSTGEAMRVRICGAFARANVNTGIYFPPEAGYMYYSCKAGEEALCRMQWNEIAKAAGKCVAYGARRGNGGMGADNGTVRTALPPQNPDVYLTGLGVTVMPMIGDAPTQCKAAALLSVTTTACDDAPVPADMLGPGPTPDLSAGGGDMTAPPPPPPKTGCSMGEGRGSTNVGALGLLGLGLVLILRPRRQRRPRGS